TRRTLAEAACYLCTNPTCRRFTARPAADGAGSGVLGRAAHIHAASPKGPRSDPTQSHEERVSEANGIWLCSECAAAVGHKLDVRRYAAEELRNWKQRHHHWLKNDGHVPEVPSSPW